MSYARRHSTNVCPGNRVRYTSESTLRCRRLIELRTPLKHRAGSVYSDPAQSYTSPKILQLELDEVITRSKLQHGQYFQVRR